MRHHQMLTPHPLLLLCAAWLFWLPALAQQGDRQTRAAQWDAYQLPAGNFTRIVDKQLGYAIWLPPEWKEEPGQPGTRVFKPAPQGVNLMVLTEEIPEGLGVASYVSSMLQGLRQRGVPQETVTVRPVRVNGLEWREVAYEVEAQGGALIHQTMWLTAVGARAYAFALSAPAEEMERHEPSFKRMMTTARIGAAGHWDAEFENLRAQLAAPAQPVAGREVEAASIAAALRTGRETMPATTRSVAELFNRAPDAAFDLLSDADAQVRTAAIAALGQMEGTPIIDALVWALSDKDVYASVAAARGLAARGTSGLAAFKNKLPVLAETPSAIVRAGVTMGDAAARELIAELLRGDGAKQHLAALQLALALPDFNLSLPYAKLVNSPDVSVLHTLVAVLHRHRPAEAAGELRKLLRGDTEVWAARALGEVAPLETADVLNGRVDEIDTRLVALGKANARAPRKGSKRAATKPRDTVGESGENFALVSVAELKAKPEMVRLVLARGQLEVAARKITLRDRWRQTADEAARRAILAEINREHPDLSGWARTALTRTVAPAPPPNFDPAKLPSTPTTGWTLFPQTTISYVMAPNLAGTMAKLDAALSGVQMATVRDQMTFALLLRMLKTSLAEKTGVHETDDAGKATGIDLNAPLALASWPAQSAASGGAPATNTLHSAMVLRVTDRARFERLLATYQESLGGLDSLAVGAAALARFASVIPAVLPVVFASLASDEARGKIAGRVLSAAERPALATLKPFALVRREQLGELPVTVLEQSLITASGAVQQETVYLAYLSETAIIAPHRDALLAVLKTAGGGQPSIAQNEGFARARKEQGELVFFSELKAILRLLDAPLDGQEGDDLATLLKVFGAESGTLQLTASSWETTFNLALKDSEFTKSFQPFNPAQLAATRELLPRTTILYAGAMVDPAKLWRSAKSLETPADKKKLAENARDKEIDENIEKLIVPQMQGEMAAALVSFNPIFGDSEWPALALAVKLKSRELGEALRAGKLFASCTRVPNVTALGSPVVALGENNDAPFVAVTDDYLVLADSVATLRMLEAKEKFSASRDFARATVGLPENLALFATYNLEAAFDEASKVLSDSSSRELLPFVSAVIHAFHSQRALMTIEPDGLRGRLAVAFDREGRYSVGELANRAGDFDVANALIVPQGLTVVQSPRVEAMTLRIAAKQPGMIARVRDDLSKFAWQRIETSNDATVVVTTSARHIPDKQTIPLPVAGAEFAPYLNSTAQINSRAPQIIALAKQIAGDDKDGRSVARKIGEWTYKNLKWKKVESDAAETLASREADCLEHAELYVALARASGLPARVVSGAALGDGAFGAHAWVEIYLGKWFEVDPTWGLLEHVDATHLRFDGDAFISYAMLNQLAVEITAVRRQVADFQRDPVRLVKEFSLDANTRHLAFDLALVAETTLDAEAWAKLNEKQRAATVTAFERTLRGLWETWDGQAPLPVRVLKRETMGARQVLTVLRGEVCLRFTLVQRDGAWFIVEHEVVDDGLPEFADALRGALKPEARRGRIYDVAFEAAFKHLDRLIATEGERPELLLLKARVFSSQQAEEENARLMARLKGDAAKDKQTPPAAPAEPVVDRAVELLQQITTRWPDFAPGHLALGRELLYSNNAEEALNPLSKDTQQAVAALQSYARLAPHDPRPWRDLATAFNQLERFSDAEAAYQAAIERDPGYLDHHAALVQFHLEHEATMKAKAAFAKLLTVAADPDEAFALLWDEEGFDPDAAKVIEELLGAFPKELGASKAGLSVLAEVQEAQNKLVDAVKTVQRAIAIEAAADDYIYLSQLYRRQRRFIEALNAANQALKLDAEAMTAHFERACALAQLERKREALAALKQMLRADAAEFFDAEEPDLQPLVNLPEFKALKAKMQEASAPSETTAQPEQTDKEKGKP